jgi:hypothetical protein
VDGTLQFLTPSTDADTGFRRSPPPRTLDSKPGLRGRIEFGVDLRNPIAPARRIFLKGNKAGIGKIPPLRKTASAAYGIGRDSIADATAVGCPVSPFFASTAQLRVLPVEERAHPARPVGDGRSWFHGWSLASGPGGRISFPGPGLVYCV